MAKLADAIISIFQWLKYFFEIVSSLIYISYKDRKRYSERDLYGRLAWEGSMQVNGFKQFFWAISNILLLSTVFAYDEVQEKIQHLRDNITWKFFQEIIENIIVYGSMAFVALFLIFYYLGLYFRKELIISEKA